MVGTNGEKKVVKEIIDNGSKYLAGDDLHGFYQYALNSLKDYGTLGTYDIIGSITEIFDKCGIPLHDYFSQLGYIPAGFCSNAPIPKEFISNKTLSFDKDVNYIGEFAFHYTDTYNVDTLDLRNVETVKMGAFDNCIVDTIILGEELIKYLIGGGKQYVDNIFSFCQVSTLEIPQKFEDTDISRVLYNLFVFSSTCVTAGEFNIYYY